MRSNIEEFTMKCVNDFGSIITIFDGMIYGTCERKYFLNKHDQESNEIKSIWNEAGNKVMFLKPELNGN